MQSCNLAFFFFDNTTFSKINCIFALVIFIKRKKSMKTDKQN